MTSHHPLNSSRPSAGGFLVPQASGCDLSSTMPPEEPAVVERGMVAYRSTHGCALSVDNTSQSFHLHRVLQLHALLDCRPLPGMFCSITFLLFCI